LQLLREYIRERLLSEELDVRGYIKPLSSFRTLKEWESIAGEFLELQKIGVDTRVGKKEKLDPRVARLVEKYFGFQLNVETDRYDLLTEKNILDFVEDFVNHRFWGFEREFSSYFPDMSGLRFAYFYSRGDLEPYVLLDEEFTMQVYGDLDNRKNLYHYTTERGMNRIQQSIDSGDAFDISCFTMAERPFFRPESNYVVELVGNVRAGFRSDIKSVAVDNGRRACNMHRLEYPGRDQDNLCRELDSCDGSVRTSLWNEYIATPEMIVDVKKP
jgi:hypothetical protein